MDDDTIFAPATGAGRAGIAVVRISGPEAGGALRRLIGARPPPARRLVRARFADGAGQAIDDGLAVWFPAPNSFTGEDVAELHVHGGRAVIAALLETLGAFPGLRAAEPGEFSRRAFENGKLDLTAAEGLADLVAAETAAQRRQALRQMQGELGALYEDWRRRLVRLLAHIEAVIDFADEDLPPGLEGAGRRELRQLTGEVEAHLADGGRGERLRDGIRIAVVGPPNAGKSSLVNRIARRDAAIVSRLPGTTRDVIEVQLDLGGFPVTVADTAGLREGGEEIEREGVRRSRLTAAGADLVLAVFDGERWPAIDADTRALLGERTLAVVNKSDLLDLDAPPRVADRVALAVSALTGEGLGALLAALQREVAARFDVSAAPALTRVRHRQALQGCREALLRAAWARETELLAEDLRLAVRELGRITGRVAVEEVLDVVFHDFCIGK